MKISDFRIWPVGNPQPSVGGPCWIFVQLITDGGVIGVGEIYGLPFRPQTAVQMARDVCERRVIGHNPFQVEELWRAIYSSAYTQRPDLSLGGILSAVEMACWDIIGKETGRPVYELLGGRVRDTLRSYTYLYPEEGDNGAEVYENPQAAARRAVQYVEQGFTAVKFDPAGPYTIYDPRQLTLADLRRSEEFMRELRTAVGDTCDLLFGTHGQMTPAAAVRLAKRLEPYAPLWLEEPTPPENTAAMAKVAVATAIPIAAGERLTSKYEFQRLLQDGAATILQMNLGRVGGILEAKKIAGMAEAHYAQIAPHLYCGPVIGAANIQLSACIPNFLILEGIKRWDGFSAQILKNPIRWENGHVLVPTTPGLGVELNEEVAEKHIYAGDAMHLSPLEKPL